MFMIHMKIVSIYYRELIHDISTSTKRNVAVTATTGMASMQLGYKSTTLHHWAGILDGRYSFGQLEELFRNDDNFAAARERIQKTEILIIDEISMLSKKIFEQVESIGRHLLKKDVVFGGIQVFTDMRLLHLQLSWTRI